MPRLSPARVLQFAALAVWAVVCLFPLYWLAITSIKSLPDIDRAPHYVPFLDFTPTLDSWRFIFSDPHESLVPRFLNSLLIGTSATAVTVITAAMALYGLTRSQPSVRWPSLVTAMLAVSLLSIAPVADTLLSRIGLLLSVGLLLTIAVGLWRRGPSVNLFGAISVMLATRLLPPIVILVPLYIMAAGAKLLDTQLVLIVAYTAVNLPVALWLLQPVLGTRATEPEEAAQLDGASHLAILFEIVLPMIGGGLMAAGVVVFLLCWNEYLFAVSLTSDHALTLPPWMVGQLSMKEAQVGGEAEEIGRLSAAAVLMIVPPLCIAAFARELLARSFASKSRP